MPIYDIYFDRQGRIHDIILDGETGEPISDTVRTEADPDEINDKEKEDK